MTTPTFLRCFRPLMKSPSATKTMENPRAKNAVRPTALSRGAAARFTS